MDSEIPRTEPGVSLIELRGSFFDKLKFAADRSRSNHFWMIQYRIEADCRLAQSTVTFVEITQLDKRGIKRAPLRDS